LALKLFNPKNSNNHPQEQIERLADIIKYSGWRKAINISKLSNKIISGHGRVLVAEYMGLEKVPVVYQEYDDDIMEYLDLTADNAIASWSELSFEKINEDVLELGPFDINLLGLKDFEAVAEDKYPIEEEKDEKCPVCGK